MDRGRRTTWQTACCTGFTCEFDLSWHVDTEVKNARNEYVTSSSDSDVDQGSTFFPQSDQVWNIDFIVGQFPDEFDADRRIVTLYGTLFYHDAFENPRKAQILLYH